MVKTATSHDLSTWLLLTQPPITGVFWQLHHFSATTSLRSAKTLSWCHTKLPSSQILFILNYGSWVFEPKRINIFCVIIHVNKKIFWAAQNGAGVEVQARVFLQCAQQFVKQSGPRVPGWALWSFPLAAYLRMRVYMSVVLSRYFPLPPSPLCPQVSSLCLKQDFYLFHATGAHSTTCS